MVWLWVRVVGWSDEVARKRAVNRRTDGFALGAQVRLTAGTLAAITAGVELGLGSNSVSDARYGHAHSHVHHHPGHFVPHDDRRPSAEVVVIDMDVSSASPSRLHIPLNASRRCLWLFDIANLDVADTRIYFT